MFNKINSMKNPCLFIVALMMLVVSVGMGQTAYIANGTDSTVSVIDVNSNTVTHTIQVGFHTVGVSVSPDGNKVYVGNTSNNTISVINTATNTVTAIIPVGSYPIGICVSPDNSKVYVANSFDNTVDEINALAYGGISIEHTL